MGEVKTVLSELEALPDPHSVPRHFAARCSVPLENAAYVLASCAGMHAALQEVGEMRWLRSLTVRSRNRRRRCCAGGCRGCAPGWGHEDKAVPCGNPWAVAPGPDGLRTATRAESKVTPGRRGTSEPNVQSASTCDQAEPGRRLDVARSVSIRFVMRTGGDRHGDVLEDPEHESIVPVQADRVETVEADELLEAAASRDVAVNQLVDGSPEFLLHLGGGGF